MLDTNARRVKAGMVAVAIAAATAANAEPLTPSGELDEQVTDAAQVSMSRIVVGVVADETPRANDARVGAAVAPEWRGDTMCARFLSSDSTYEGSREYVIPTTLTAPVGELDFPTTHGDTLAALTTSEFAISLTRGDCDNDGRDFAVALWRTDAYDPDAAILVLINAQGADESYVYLPEEDIEAPCTALGHGQGVGFDHACRIPRSELPAEGPVLVEVNRATGGAFEEPEQLTIWLGAAS